MIPIALLEKFSLEDFNEKVQVGKDQEKVQSKNESHSKKRDGKKLNQQSGTNNMETYHKPNGQLFSQ